MLRASQRRKSLRAALRTEIDEQSVRSAALTAQFASQLGGGSSRQQSAINDLFPERSARRLMHGRLAAVLMAQRPCEADCDEC